MRAILHILTGPEEELARELIERQRALPDTKVEIVVLTDGTPNYDELVEHIFSADSVQVW
jgi:hypothetical protein